MMLCHSVLAFIMMWLCSEDNALLSLCGNVLSFCDDALSFCVGVYHDVVVF